MSVKRQATSELNHDNWNEDDPAEAKEMGQFRTAAKDVLEKRVIRTARRKNPMSSEANKSVFSGFGGFNKTQPSSFDFLANLTNGTKNTNGSTGPGIVTTMPTGLFTGGSIGLGPITTVTPGLFTSGSIGPALVTTVSTGLFTSGSLGPGPVTTVSTGLFTSGSLGPGPVTTVTTSLFTSKPPSANAGIFGIQTSTTPMSSGPTTMTSPFGSTVKTSPSSFFSMTKADGTKETPFKIQPITSSQIDITKSTGPTPPSVFGVPTTSANDSKQLFSSKNSTPFNKEPASSTNDTMIQASLGTSTKPAVNSVTPEKKDDSEKSNEKTIKYYSKLKGLNESVSDWINKHVAQTPLCILSPIFKDYEKYLKEITEEYQTGDKEVSENDGNNSGKQTDKTQDVKTSSPFTNNKTGSSPFSNNSSEVTKASMPFGINNSGASSKINSFGQENKMSTPFGVNNNAPSPFTNQNTNTTSPFAIKNVGSSPLSNQEAKSSPFGVNNTSSPQFTSPNAKISSPFGINNAGASPLNSQEKASTPFGINNSSPFNSNNSSAAPKLLFGSQSTVAPTSDNKAPTFSFGGNSATNATNTSTPNTGFSFGVTPSATSTSASPFVLNTNTSGNTAGSAPFSFGSGKPFSFAPNTVQQPSSESAAAENEDDEPPKVEYTPVKEDNSVYEKKCKIFVKKDNNFADKGVGTLYIKKIEGNVKHQLLVRANTNLGTVLLNLVLAEGIPAQRMGKNNVMLVCIPTPDAKPPPTPILIRVKTGEEADELLETLNKYKA